MNKYLLILVTLFCVACTSMGPQTIPNDQFNYNDAIANASREQMLNNLIRMRYAETPTFLRVSSVISQYTRGASANVGVGANSSATGGDTASAGGRVRWSDRPVITYTPVTGQEFVQDLLTPPGPGQMLEMLQAGWPADLVIRTSILSVNGVDNSTTLPSRRREADAEFYEMFRLWTLLGGNGLLELRRSPEADGSRLMMFVTPEPDAEFEPDLNRFREILSLDPGITEFHIVSGKARKSNEIAILAGSLWDTMSNIAWQISVPSKHVDGGRTATTFSSTQPSHVPPIDVRHSISEPDNPYVAVFKHDHWFYIDQGDWHSKRVFTFLEILINLTEKSVASQAPLMTISN
jgi:hypothetical protein